MEVMASVYGFSYFLQNEASTKEKYAARTGQVGAKYVQNSIFPILFILHKYSSLQNGKYILMLAAKYTKNIFSVM